MPFLEEEAQVLSRKDSGDPPENPLQKRSLPREHPAAPAFEAVPLKAPDLPGRGAWLWEASSFHSTSCCLPVPALGPGEAEMRKTASVFSKSSAVGTHMLGWSREQGLCRKAVEARDVGRGGGLQVGGPGLWRTTKRPGHSKM